MHKTCCEFLDSIIEEIGEENVMQVVTDRDAALVKVFEFLMKRKNYSGHLARHINLI